MWSQEFTPEQGLGTNCPCRSIQKIYHLYKKLVWGHVFNQKKGKEKKTYVSEWIFIIALLLEKYGSFLNLLLGSILDHMKCANQKMVCGHCSHFTVCSLPVVDKFISIADLRKNHAWFFRCASISSSDDRDWLTDSLTRRLEIYSPIPPQFSSLRLRQQPKWNVTHDGMSLKMECHSIWNVNQNGMSLKMECHSNWSVA